MKVLPRLASAIKIIRRTGTVKGDETITTLSEGEFSSPTNQKANVKFACFHRHRFLRNENQM